MAARRATRTEVRGFGTVRSKLEASVVSDLLARGREFGYESEQILLAIPHLYTPDLTLPNGVHVEIKGAFPSDDRKKVLAAHEAGHEVRMVFGNANARAHGCKAMTNAQWCDKHGIPWADKVVPEEWFE